MVVGLKGRCWLVNWLSGWRKSRCGIARLKNLANCDISFFRCLEIAQPVVRKNAEKIVFQDNESMLVNLASDDLSRSSNLSIKRGCRMESIQWMKKKMMQKKMADAAKPSFGPTSTCFPRCKAEHSGLHNHSRF